MYFHAHNDCQSTQVSIVFASTQVLYVLVFVDNRYSNIYPDMDLGGSPPPFGHQIAKGKIRTTKDSM